MILSRMCFSVVLMTFASFCLLACGGGDKDSGGMPGKEAPANIKMIDHQLTDKGGTVLMTISAPEQAKAEYRYGCYNVMAGEWFKVNVCQTNEAGLKRMGPAGQKANLKERMKGVKHWEYPLENDNEIIMKSSVDGQRWESQYIGSFKIGADDATYPYALCKSISPVGTEMTQTNLDRMRSACQSIKLAQ